MNQVNADESKSFAFKNLFYLLWFVLTYTCKILFILIKIILTLLLISAFISAHLPTQQWIFKNFQACIYPVMRQLRLLTLPLLKKYPYLSNYHEQDCLILNPFYKDPNLECWPCENIPAIIELTNFSDYAKTFTFQGRPFVVKNVIKKPITLEILTQVYFANKKDLTVGTTKFLSSLKKCFTLDQYFEKTCDRFRKDVNVVWKINRVPAVRVIRKIFPRPYFIPIESEVSLERYIFFDGPQSSQYKLPLTEFANVWLVQGQGNRLIILDPSETCRKNCSSVSILLTPKDVLYYNWQIYRPRSVSANFSSDLSITFIGSFY